MLPSPAKAPIDEMFRSPGAAWLMLVFGVTLAPFFEEILFRGFLLSTLATAWDWAIEQGTGKAPPPARRAWPSPVVHLRHGRRLHLHQPSLRRLTDRKSTRLNSSHLGISYAVF